MGKTFTRVLKRGNRGNAVKEWQNILKVLGYDISVDGYFGANTEKATKQFQNSYGLIIDGIVGSVTHGIAANIVNYKSVSVITIRTEKELLAWIAENLGGYIRKAIAGTSYSEDWLGAIACRETGFLIIKYVNQGLPFDEICEKMYGDFRKGRYNGFGFWQIDIGSYPGFIESGLWIDPLATVKQAIICLDGKRHSLKSWEYALNVNDFERAITAAYNCGQGRVMKALDNGYDIDRYTFNRDYSGEVFRMRKIYREINIK